MTTIAPISVQLYSLREEAAIDFPAVLRRLGETGFVGVELAGFHGLSPAEFARISTDAGLVVSSAHINDVTPDAFKASLDDLQSVGCDTVVQAFLPPADFADLSVIGERAEALNVAGAIARERGVTLGYHNHFWEFQNQFDGRSALSIFFDQLDPSIVAELDIYWAIIGGADPKQVIADFGSRLALLHVKDGPGGDPQSPMVAVGSGTVDIAGILGSAPTAKWHIVELDRCSTDMFTAVADSYRFLVGEGLSRGRL
jgi:sugar phosphate isomerase/epimerase